MLGVSYLASFNNNANNTQSITSTHGTNCSGGNSNSGGGGSSVLGVSYNALKININSNVVISDTEGRGCSGGLAAMSVIVKGEISGLSVVLLNSVFKNVSSGHSRSSVSATYGNSGAIRISAPGATASSGVVAQVHQGSFTSCSVLCSGGSCTGGAIGVANAQLNMSGILR